MPHVIFSKSRNGTSTGRGGEHSYSDWHEGDGRIGIPSHRQSYSGMNHMDGRNICLALGDDKPIRSSPDCGL